MLLVRPLGTGEAIDNQRTFVWQVPAGAFAESHLIQQGVAEIQALLARAHATTELTLQAPNTSDTHWEALFPQAECTRVIATEVHECTLCCIDKRIAHSGKPTNNNTSGAQTTCPGGALLFDLMDHEPLYSVIQQVLVQQMQRDRIRITQCDYHVGIDGSAGCAFYRDLPNAMRAQYATLDDIIAMLHRTRDTFISQAIADTNCCISVTAIDKNGLCTVFDMEKEGDITALKQHQITL